jgi:hypothetical protein
MKLGLAVLLLAIPCLAQIPNCVPAPPGLVGWWRGDGNADDSFGTNNGTTINSVDFETGQVGQCFHFVSGPNPRVFVPDNPAFQLTNSLTIEGWIKANFGWYILDRGSDTPGEFAYGIGISSLKPGFALSAPNGDYILLETPSPIPTNVWLHLAATLEGASGDMRIYINGQVAAETNTTVRPRAQLTGPNASVCIGNVAGTGGFPFDGWIDELSLYSRALSQAEVQSIYNAGSAGKCLPAPPTIVSQPQGVVGYWGASVTFNVQANGSVPLGYLWYKDGFPITWATDSSLVLTNLTLDQGGNYYVVVTNAYGSATSSNAFLTVNPAGVSLGVYPGLTVQGTPGKMFGIQYATNVAPNSTWLTLTQFTLLQPSQMWFDADNNIANGSNPRRFYRVVAVP